MSTVQERGAEDLEASVRRIAAEESLSGVVRVDLDGVVAVEAVFGDSHRGLEIEMSVDAQLAIASGSKTFTALVVMSLVQQGTLTLGTLARSILGDDLPLVDERVTVEHLLAHRSGIGDYLDEDMLDDPDAYVLSVPVHELVTTEDFLSVLDGHPTKFAPGERFAYCNGGYVVLALLAERVCGQSFHELVDELVCRPAGMIDTAYLRSDALPGRAALGYLDDGLKTNVFHLPVRGNGDGGIYTTVADVHSFWEALLAGRIVPLDVVAEMTRPRSETSDGMRYGLGFWVDPDRGTMSIHGFDAGVGFVSVHDPTRHLAFSVLSNSTRGAWPCSQRISQLLSTMS